MADRSFEEFKAAILFTANEDLTGVYVAWWSANTWYPSWPLSERLHYAERAVRELADEGLIDLFRGTWDDAKRHRVPTDERDAGLLATPTDRRGGRPCPRLDSRRCRSRADGGRHVRLRPKGGTGATRLTAPERSRSEQIGRRSARLWTPEL